MPLLLESGDYLLLESGDKLLLENEVMLATGYSITGPTEGEVGAQVTYTIHAEPDGSTFFGDEVFTPAVAPDGTISGPVTPAPVATSVTFTFTPVTKGNKTISVTNDQGWTDPADIIFDAYITHTLRVRAYNAQGARGSIATTTFQDH